MTSATITRCPEWCTLAGHGWDSTEAAFGRVSRGHGGPNFGIVGVGGTEYPAALNLG